MVRDGITHFNIRISIHQETLTGAFLGLFPLKPLPPSHKGFEQSTTVTDLIWDPRVWGIFRNCCSKSKKAEKSLHIFFFFFFKNIFLFQKKFVLGERSSFSAHQLQLFFSVLSWPLHRFCCQGPGLLGSTGGMPAARCGYAADIRSDWERARAGTHESIALSAWLPARLN